MNSKATSITEALFFPFAFAGRLPAVYLLDQEDLMVVATIP